MCNRLVLQQFADTGLLCHLLGIETERALLASPFAGPVFESFVASEIVKAQVHAGRAKNLYVFRDGQGLEVDFVIPRGGGKLLFVEAKSTRSLRPADADPLVRLLRAAGPRATARLVHRRVPGDPDIAALRPGVRAVGVGDLPALLR